MSQKDASLYKKAKSQRNMQMCIFMLGSGKKWTHGAGKVAQWFQALAALAEGPGLVPPSTDCLSLRSYPTAPSVLLWTLGVCVVHVCVCRHPHIHIRERKKNIILRSRHPREMWDLIVGSSNRREPGKLNKTFKNNLKIMYFECENVSMCREKRSWLYCHLVGCRDWTRVVRPVH